MTDKADFSRRSPNGLVWTRGKQSRAILEDIWTHPGATTAEIAERLGGMHQNNVAHALRHLVSLGLVSRHKDHTYYGRGVRYCYHLMPNVATKRPKAQIVAVPQLRITSAGDLVVDELELPLEQTVELPAKLATKLAELLPDQVAELDRLREIIVRLSNENGGLSYRVDELNEQVDELRQWKANAIAKYPDLHVDPLLIRAREIAADICSNENTKLAILAGNHDAAASVRAAMAALRLSQKEA